jgi:predicted metal-dependent phosphoesterase TrpH
MMERKLEMPPRYDLHMHSRHSVDSLNRPARIIAAAQKRGLAGIAVTDHDSIAGGLEASRLAPAGFVVIVGAEYYTEAGDIVALFLSREIKSRTAVDVINEAHDQGGLAFLPHPLRGHRGLTDAVLRAVDGFEVLNSRAGWFDPLNAASALPDWSLLGGKAALGCSDAHLISEIGRAYTVIEGPRTAENVRAAIQAAATQPGGRPGPARNFYMSQFVKATRTGNFTPAFRFLRRRLPW